jgi:hypothetical protein
MRGGRRRAPKPNSPVYFPEGDILRSKTAVHEHRAFFLEPTHRLGQGRDALHSPRYSFSKPWLVNFSVRLFSVTVRTT